MSDIILSGTAVMPGGAWYAHEKLDAPMARSFRNRVHVYGNHCKWFMTPDTARSMASALMYYAEQADAFEGRECNTSADYRHSPPIQPNPNAIKWAPGQEPMFNADRKLEAVREQSRKHNMSEHRKIVAAAPPPGTPPKSAVAKAIYSQKEKLMEASRESCEHHWATNLHNQMSIRYCKLCNAFDYDYHREELDRARREEYAKAEKDIAAALREASFAHRKEEHRLRMSELDPAKPIHAANCYEWMGRGLWDAADEIEAGEHRKQDT